MAVGLRDGPQGQLLGFKSWLCYLGVRSPINPFLDFLTCLTGIILCLLTGLLEGKQHNTRAKCIKHRISNILPHRNHPRNSYFMLKAISI
jgi:hypothetical protein